MAKRLIKFDGEEYSIEETKFDPAISKLAQFLTDELAGTGVTIKLGGRTYSVDGERVSTATDGFTSYLESIEGDDINVRVSGTTYGLSRAAVEGGYETVGETWRGMAEEMEPEQTPSEGLEYQLNEDGISYRVCNMGTCTDTEIVIPSEYQGLPVTTVAPFVYRNLETTMGAFEAAPITKVIIPDSVTTLGDFSFPFCENLTTVVIGNGVLYTGFSLFEGSNSLKDIYINKSENDFIDIDWRLPKTCVVHWNSTGPDSN